MATKNEIKVGQAVWVYTPGHRGDGELKEKTVFKCGSKYFYVGTERWFQKFEYETMIEVVESNYRAKAYLTKQEYDDIQERSELLLSIRKHFDGYSRSHLTLQQLRDINAIINSIKYI